MMLILWKIESVNSVQTFRMQKSKTESEIKDKVDDRYREKI